ncbi:MAG: hypothetical protein JWP12_429 [Bacteroidetes bacterium]|nr:hypothetical protein [Bacteroidota bacterium]
MKKCLRLSCILIVFNCLCTFAAFGQTTSSTTSHELVLSIPLITDKNIDAIKNTLLHTSGLTVYGYCNAYKCFLLTYDPAVFESGETVAAMLQAAYPEYKTEIKIGVTISQLIDNCTHYPLPVTGTAR